jgi:hypothetical protein
MGLESRSLTFAILLIPGLILSAQELDIDPTRVAESVMQSGGTLRDMARNCGTPRHRTYGQVDWTITACSWGEQNPAVLIELLNAENVRSVVVVAATEERWEVLAEDTTPPSVVADLNSLPKEDFDALLSNLIGSVGL